MEHFFQQNEADFNRLAQMAAEDKAVWLVAHNDFEVLHGDPSDGGELRRGTQRDLSDERLDEYRRLLIKLKLHSLTKSGRPGGSSINLLASVRRLSATDYDQKGYAFLVGEKQIADVYDTLDDKADGLNGHPQPYYKLIKDNWYLYHMGR